MKRIVSIIICILLVGITIVYAIGDNLIFTVQDAQETAKMNSKQIKIDDLEIKTKQSELEEAKDEAKEKGGRPGRTISQTLDNLIIGKVNPLIAETNLEIARMNKDNNIKELKLNVYKLTQEILLTQKELDIEKQKLIILQEKYEINKAKFTEGNITNNDLFNFEYEIDSKEIKIREIEQNITTLSLELKKLLDLPLDENIIAINDELKAEVLKDFDIESSISKALESNISIYEKSQNVKAKELTLELTSKYYNEGDSRYNEAKYDMESAKVDLEDTKINLEVDIRNKYNELQNLKDQLELAEKYFDLISKNVKIANTKYESGTISKYELLQLKEKMLDATYQKYLAIYNYNIAKQELLNMVD
ncbi:hypothetical protein TR13x_04970 [Caloranaerobacter sp. TR13]|uniref:TolC family protein n=1 Tax=Caloranaerobacter sp. TR13 TaxID=1302151 RepID=UPI0006D46F09|nr:TolC family protein [Caloranaerobacter sp. TR13]KPU27425.1 hypothetical protein TR13x_04970 [Caloranaerobacter sp. TR13]